MAAQVEAREVSTATTPQRRTHWSITFAVLAVAVAAFTLLQSMVIPVLGLIAVEMNTDMPTATWVLTAYLLSASICTPLLGRIGDVVGKQRMLVVTLVALALGSLLAALSTHISVLIVARVLQGAGGGVLPLSFGIIRDEFPERHRGTGLSVIASLAAVGFGIGIVLAGPIVDVLGYHWLFWLPMIVTSLAALAAARFIPASPVAERTRLPVAPAILLAAWLSALLLAISQGNTWGWGSAAVIGLLVASALIAAGWVVIETRVEVPMVDMRMMRQRGIWTTNVVNGFVGFGMFSAFGFLPQMLQTPVEAGYGFGASISESGRIMLPSAITSFLVGFVVAHLVRRVGSRAVIVTGTLLTGASFGAIALWHDSVEQIVAATILQGLGGGLVFSSLAAVVVASVPPSQTGVASGMNANIRTVGGAIGSAVMAGIVAAHAGPGDLPAETGYVIGFALLAAGMVIAALAAMAIPNHRPDGGRATAPAVLAPATSVNA